MTKPYKSFKWRYDQDVKDRLKIAAKNRERSENWMINSILRQVLTDGFVAGTERLF